MSTVKELQWFSEFVFCPVTDDILGIKGNWKNRRRSKSVLRQRQEKPSVILIFLFNFFFIWNSDGCLIKKLSNGLVHSRKCSVKADKNKWKCNCFPLFLHIHAQQTSFATSFYSKSAFNRTKMDNIFLCHL